MPQIKYAPASIGAAALPFCEAPSRARANLRCVSDTNLELKI